MGILKRSSLVIALGLLGLPLMASAGRVVVGVGVGVGWPYYGYGPGYYSPYYYGPSYYYYPPPVVYAPPAVTVEQAPAAYWYYCPPARAYFPYVRECPVGWLAVAATARPHAAAQPPVQAPTGQVTYSLGDVLFATGKSDLRPAATGTLDTLLASISKEPERSIVVEGHTDSVGKAAANRELSQRRADAVMQYLIAHGIAPQRITAIGKGEEHPVDSNATADGRRHNRRVDVILN